MITEQHTKECLSLAYIHALAGRAGVNLHVGRIHDYGVDGTLHSVTIWDKRRVESGFALDFQLKATARWAQEAEHIVYDLEAKTYNDLVTRLPEALRCVLIVLCLPRDATKWLQDSETEMILRHCCYWCHLEGAPIKNTGTKRIRIPRANALSPESLSEVLQQERERRLSA